MENKVVENNIVVSQLLAAIQAQIQTVGRRMDRLAQPQTPPQRRTAMKNITPPPPMMASRRNVPPPKDPMDDEQPPYSDDDDPKPPDRLTRVPRRSGQHVQQKQGGFNYLKYNPTVFAGSCNPHAYLAWVRSMEELFDNYNYPEAKKVEIATNQLKGDAKSWWARETTRRYHYNSTFSWTEMKHHMKGRYVPKDFPKYVQKYYDYKPYKSLKPFSKIVSSQCITTSIMHLSLPKEAETGLGIIIPNGEYKSEDEQEQKEQLNSEKDVQYPDHGDLLVTRRTYVKSITPSQDAIEEADFGEAPDSDDVDPKPPEHQTRIPKRVDSLLIKETNPYNQPYMSYSKQQNQGVLYSMLIKEAHPNSYNMNTSKLMKPQGKHLNPFSYFGTNLLSLQVEKSVLRTKPCQEGGDDISMDYELESNKEKDASKARMKGNQAWDPGETLWKDLTSSYTTFEQPKTRHHTYLPKLSRYKQNGSTRNGEYVVCTLFLILVLSHGVLQERFLMRHNTYSGHSKPFRRFQNFSQSIWSSFFKISQRSHLNQILFINSVFYD